MPKQPAKKELLTHILIPLAAITILALATFNLQSYLSEDKIFPVLGQSTTAEEEVVFWEDFLQENPDYLPGWREYAQLNNNLGNNEKYEAALNRIEELDPNYNLEAKD